MSRGIRRTEFGEGVEEACRQATKAPVAERCIVLALEQIAEVHAELRRVAAQIEERPNALVTGKSTTEEFKP